MKRFAEVFLKDLSFEMVGMGSVIKMWIVVSNVNIPCPYSLVGKPEGRRPLGRPRRGWEDNTKMDLREVGWGHGLDQSGSGYGQVVSSCECGYEPSGSIKCGEFLE
jgi:hypothetical protein